MPEVTKKVKRKTISKKLRFEVFKRDSFTCQYCGAKAPDVLLHVDHITPVSKGGKNTLLNLVTACECCNLGKSNEPLDENAAVKKAQEQAKILQERREQIEMMRDWQMGLVDEMQMSLQAVNDLYQHLTNGKYRINDSFLYGTIKSLVNRFGLSEVMESMRCGFETYDDSCMVLEKLGGICYTRKNPQIRRRAYIKGILNNKIYYGEIKSSWFVPLMDRGYEAGGESFLDDVEKWAKGLRRISWSSLQRDLENMVAEYEEE